jgi:hypothetical protein
MSHSLGSLLGVLSGAIVMGYVVAGVFFLRFWRETRDRLFLIFALAFFVLGVQRMGLALSTTPVEARTDLYLVRLFAFLMILLAIVDKNRTGSRN